MRKTTTSSLLTVVLSGVALVGCGSDPYVGDSTATDTGTSTSTKNGTGSETSTGISANPDAGVDAADPPLDPNQVNIYVNVSPVRLLDLVVMIDNSPSMAPKVAKLNAQFPKLIAGLKSSVDGTLPDLRVAVIDSDLGTGCHYTSGSCGPKNPDGSGCYGDQGKFQMLSAPSTCQFNAGSEFLEIKGNQPVNFTGPVDNVNNAFACLAGNLGTMGCGEEHQLQAFEWALYLAGVGNEQQQRDFLRGSADLGLVFLTDEDDCSAATNDGMFGDNNSNPALADLRGESASLRCATRGHMCGGQNLSDVNPPGYPTNGAYSHPFNDCAARVDGCSNATDGTAATDTSRATSCSPLKSIVNLARELKSLKADPAQILVAGIFGWPRSDADMATAQYKIAPIPNPNVIDTAHPTVYDYWPICYDPDHLPTPASTDPATGFDPTAAGWSATGGLREAAFIDQFGGNGMKFSICERDFSNAMTTIGTAWAGKPTNLCIPYKLRDSDLATAGLQPDCRVVWRIPVMDPTDPTKVIYQESASSLPVCPAGASSGEVATDCWQLVDDMTKCPPYGQLVQVLRTAAEIAASPQIAAGTKVGLQCRVCQTGSAESACTY